MNVRHETKQHLINLYDFCTFEMDYAHHHIALKHAPPVWRFALAIILVSPLWQDQSRKVFFNCAETTFLVFQPIFI